MRAPTVDPRTPGSLRIEDVAEPRPGAHELLVEALAAGRRLQIDAGGLNRELVLENDVVVGPVNADLRHYQAAAAALEQADATWLRRTLDDEVAAG